MHLKFITNKRKKNILQEKIEKLFKAKEDIDFDIWIKFLRDNAESTFATIIDTKKSIYGTATPEERKELAEEGIDLLSIPWISKDN